MKYYMTTNPITLTNIETLENTTFTNLDEWFNYVTKKSCEVYCYELSDIAMAIVNTLYNNEYKEQYSFELKKANSRLEEKAFVQISAKDELNTYTIRFRHDRYRHIKVINVANMFGNFKKMDIVKANGFFPKEYKPTLTVEEIKRIPRPSNALLETVTLGMCAAIEELHAKGHKSITVSSNAFNDLKRTCFYGEGYKEVNGKMVKKDYTETNFRKVFPKLDAEVHDFIISSFQNGICAFNEDYKGIHEVNGISYDVNSLYPSVMMEEEMPIEKPEYFTGKFVAGRSYDKYFQRMKIGKLTLKEDGIACLRNSKKQEYYINATNIEVVLNHIDIENVEDNYYLEDVEYIDGYKFRSQLGGSEDMFKKYLTKWMNAKKEAKINGDDFMYQYSKQMLNSCFGKFASKTNKVPTYCWYSKRHKRYEIRPYTEKDVQVGESVYAPVGCYITSYARKRLLAAIKANKENFIYCDTDSIYVKGTATGLDIHDTEIGKWKQENEFKKIHIIGKKQYCIERHDGSIKMALAGVPMFLHDQVKSFNDFYIGKEFKFSKNNYGLDGNVCGRKEYTTSLKDENIN